MTVEERRRHQLYEGLAAVLGPEATATMMELLPPDGRQLATRSDIDRRFDTVDARFEAIDQRFDHLEQRIDDRIDALRGELLAAFRAELVSAVAGQTRAVIVATATATFGIGGLAVTLAQLL
jgi:hypothetical protein